jgi:mono/diheme cytochrome c family protein
MGRTLGVALAAALLAGCGDAPPPDRVTQTRDPAVLARGEALYRQHCAVCHGARLEGQPDWRRRLPSGRLPAPPHDDSGHTWHHTGELLFNITKHGVKPPYAPPGYESDMPGFAERLSDDDIWAVLAWIGSHWSAEVLGHRAEMLRSAGR